MPRYLVATRRKARDSSVSALDAVTGEPGITLVNSQDPHMVTIEATDDDASRLRAKLRATHIVEPEVRRSLH